MKKFIYILGLFTLVGCVSIEDEREREFYSETHSYYSNLNIKDEPLLIEKCSKEDCFKKYDLIQEQINSGNYEKAIEVAIREFGLDASGAIKISPGGSHNSHAGESSSYLEITLYENAFGSPQRLVFTLIHELGHIKISNKYYDIIKEVSGVSSSISNTKLAQFFKTIVKYKKENKIKQFMSEHAEFYWFPHTFWKTTLIIYIDNEHSSYITPEELEALAQLYGLWVSEEMKNDFYLSELEETFVEFYTLQHQDKLYLSNNAEVIQWVIRQLKSSISKEVFRQCDEKTKDPDPRVALNSSLQEMKRCFKSFRMLLRDLKKNHYRTYIFGSPKADLYDGIFEIASKLEQDIEQYLKDKNLDSHP